MIHKHVVRFAVVLIIGLIIWNTITTFFPICSLKQAKDESQPDKIVKVVEKLSPPKVYNATKIGTNSYHITGVSD